MNEKPSTTAAPDTRRIMEVAIDAGSILLQNGAEIYRVNDTMQRICRHFGVSGVDFFTLSNGLWASVKPGEAGQYSRVRELRLCATSLDKVTAVNQLSREIEQEHYTLEEAEQRLADIRAMPHKRNFVLYTAAALGASCFCYIFGGSLPEMCAALLAGLLVQIYIVKAAELRLSKITSALLGGAIVTLVCLLCHLAGLGMELGATVGGAVMPLVPGIPFINGVRDIGNGEYLAGTVRLLDALLVFLCIAIGVGVVFSIYHRLTGGLLL